MGIKHFTLNCTLPGEFLALDQVLHLDIPIQHPLISQTARTRLNWEVGEVEHKDIGRQDLIESKYGIMDPV